ncbi:MAG TPA: DUF4350 domain-containing protein [Longimicrobiales bacterium]|nr:DUF4350 domain-containing protein [Longimicrobiales bacterium]
MLTCASPVVAQQVADSAYHPDLAAPAWPAGTGPIVLFDEAHNNGHAIEGSYGPFAELLRLDGYRVRPLRKPFSESVLAGVEVLVVVNALATSNVGHWRLPAPSAFSAAEIDAVLAWVRSGGSLLLVVDHMPFPGAAADLASRLGVELMNGFAIDTIAWDPLVFRRADGSLAPHPITEARGGGERVDSVVTWWGHAFRAHAGVAAAPLLVFQSDDVMSLNPDSAWQFTPTTPAVPVRGWLQAAALKHGAGRVVVLGDAAMITAQRVGPNRQPVGMNAPGAPQNVRFVRNVLRWLCRRR